MSQPMQEKQDQNTTAQVQQPQVSDKELNFRKLEQKLELERQAREQERVERLALQEKLAKIEKERFRPEPAEEDDDDNEPYVDHKKLNRKFSRYDKEIESKIDRIATQKAQAIMEKEKQNQWLRANPDFQDVMQHAQKFADTDPEYADIILAMPEGFERQKLVYKAIKDKQLHKPPEEKPKSNIQQTIDQKKYSYHYQPSNQGAPPFGSGLGYYY